MTTVLESLNQALRSCLTDSPDVRLLGEDILDPYGGAFKVTRGLSSEFPDRVMTTPVSEAGIVGVGVGMALRGLRPVVEIMFGDFMLLAADQLVNHAAKLRWMTGDEVRVPLVVRTPMGGGRGYGPTHSQSLEKHLLGAPGLRTVAATALGDAGALLRTAVLADDDPVLFIEHKLLYGAAMLPVGIGAEFEVQESGGRYPVYQVRIAGAPAPSLTLVSYGYPAEQARLALKALAFEHEAFAELVVYTQLGPFDVRPLRESLSRTHCLLTVEEGTRTLGWGAEVVASGLEAHGPGLRAGRIASLDLPIPAARTLETAVLPGVESIVASALALLR
jgi:acetoin:2,6-dichlorophenolindophenol oxidoreductase subunit beta